MALYTSAELVQKLKDLNEQMDSAVNQSSLDTGQSKHDVRISVQTLQRQYEKYAAMLQQVDPETYNGIFGPSVVRYSSRYSSR
jgi:hypothetical protein